MRDEDSNDRESDDVSGAESEESQELAKLLREHLPERPLPPDELAKVLSRIFAFEVRSERHTQLSGPLPPPKLLAEYDQVMPGLAERIVQRADKEQEMRHDVTRHNMAISRKSLMHEVVGSYLGQVLAFLIAVLAIGGGLWLLGSGKSTEGLASIISALVALVVVFITGKVAEALSSSRSDSEEDKSSNQGD